MSFPIKHGLSRHPIHAIWNGIRQRCLNPKSAAWDDYGGRGIKMCFVWRDDFISFYLWALENEWKKGLEIDRRDNNGPYAPWNCRFITRRRNGNNKRNNVLVTAFEETKTLTEWVKDSRCRVSEGVLRNRIRAHWDHQKAITQPKQGEKIEIFGEWKSLVNWTRDPRCMVCFATFEKRIYNGWDPEIALTKKSQKQFPKSRKAE